MVSKSTISCFCEAVNHDGLLLFSYLKLDWSDYMNDIFKDMQAKVGCEYISDLPSYKRKVWQEIKRLNPADYEEKQLEDFSKYVFGMSDVYKRQIWNCYNMGMKKRTNNKV